MQLVVTTRFGAVGLVLHSRLRGHQGGSKRSNDTQPAWGPQGTSAQIAPFKVAGYLGWAYAQQGRVEEGLALMREGFNQFRALTPTGLALTQMYVILAETLWKHGDANEALSVIEEGVAHVARSLWHSLEPELYRLMGEILMQRGTLMGGEVDGAEVSLRRAVEVARRLGAKAWALRATVSLGRFPRSRQRNAEGCHVLQSATNDFTEVFDEPDLREAAELLKEVRATVRVP